ncbi:MAG: FAD-dependent oxidoreductase [Gemmatimonadaceae bacterium]
MTASTSRPTSRSYDIVFVGGGSAGLIGADFAVRLGATVAILEKDRIGGDCTWTGCVPSKTVIRSAHLAHDIARAHEFGIDADHVRADMRRVRARVDNTIASIYEHTTPEALKSRGIDVHIGATRFVDASTVRCGELSISARRIVICTGAHAIMPDIPGLPDVDPLTYGELFALETLPSHLLVLGAGPLGVEMAQAFRRLGSTVTLIGPRILAREEPEAQTLARNVLEREVVDVQLESATEARRTADGVALRTASGWHDGARVLVAAGRAPTLADLDLDRAGVMYDARGITVDAYLRTSAKHIYACGDVIGGPQFSHLAGYECFKAVRNALLPGRSDGKAATLSAVTFADPEVARVGPTEAEARRLHGNGIVASVRPITTSDRARCDGDVDGFIKILTLGRKRIVGATVVAARAGEMIAEVALAIEQGLNIDAIAETIHAYPTWSTDVQLAAVDVLMERVTSGISGRLLRWFARKG